MGGSLTIFGTQTGLPEGGTGSPISLSIAMSAIDETIPNTLTSGDNTIAVPAGCNGVIIIPPAANTQALKIKGAGADTGVTISKTNPSVITWDAAPASIIINAAGTLSAPCQFRFI